MKPIRICIGSSSNGEDAKTEAVLEYTLRKNSKRELEIHWMRQTNNPQDYWYGFQTQYWSTPFSGFRWAIPEYFNFEGDAIYMDCDMLNLRDIGDLFDIDIANYPFAARKGDRFGGHEFCVMKISCKLAKQFLTPVSRQRMLPEYHRRCINSFSGMDALVKELDPRWNCLDGDDRPVEDIWHLHWTNMATQMWKPAWYVGPQKEHPRPDLVNLFWNILKEADEHGFTESKYIPGNNHVPVKYNIIGQ